jgi:hypothetical protein
MMYGRPVGHKRFSPFSLSSFFFFCFSYYSPSKNSRPFIILFKLGKCFPSTPKFLHALQARGRREMIPLSFSFLFFTHTHRSRMDYMYLCTVVLGHHDHHHCTPFGRALPEWCDLTTPVIFPFYFIR